MAFVKASGLDEADPTWKLTPPKGMLYLRRAARMGFHSSSVAPNLMEKGLRLCRSSTASLTITVGRQAVPAI